MAHLTKWQGIVALILQVLSINVFLCFGIFGIFFRYTLNENGTSYYERNANPQNAELSYSTPRGRNDLFSFDSTQFMHNVDLYDGSMTMMCLLQQLMGALFVSYSCGSGLLLLPLLCDHFSSSNFPRTSIRTVSLHCLRLSAVLTGLLSFSMIATVLLKSLKSNGSHSDIHNNTMNSQSPEEEERNELVDLSRIFFVFLSIGMTVLSLSSLCLMVTFWPVSYRSIHLHANNHPRHAASIVSGFPESTTDPVAANLHSLARIEEQDPLVDPLLTENVDSYHLMEDGVPTMVLNNTTETQPASNTEMNEDDAVPVDPVLPIGGSTIPSSKSATRRLLQLAAPEALYLYIGCAVLLCRLPFSLAIPHFVSSTLAALANSDFHGAHNEIRLLVIAGTIDAVLDFWAFFLFGYANQRIVRSLRVELFRRLLGQEVAFFDSHSSGELASRLNSDCSEMASDLTWFFRFSIESMVRITGITAYMLIRCPILGACAISIIPAVACVNKVYGDWLRQNAIKVQDALADANEVAQEALANVRTVIAFVAESQESRRYEDRIEDQYQLNIKQLFMTALYFMGKSS
jgi:ABC-type multidrug transport system fused ATPase/permease subunit